MATRPPRITALRSYDDFQPSSNLLQEEECETLIVDLPGFRKDQIRVQMDDRTGTVMMSGERPIGNNKSSRFRKDLRVPVSCNTNEIQAKFENGVLRVIMPIKTEYKNQRPKPMPLPPPTQKPASEPKPAPTLQNPPSPKPFTGPKPIPPPPPTQKPVSEPKPSQSLPPPPSWNPRPIPAPQHPLIPNMVTESKPALIPHAPLSPRQEIASTPQVPLSQKQFTELNHVPTPKSTISQTVGIKPKFDHGQNFMSDQRFEKQIDLETGKQEHDAEKIVKEEKRIDGLDRKYMASTSDKQEEIKANVTHGAEEYKSGNKKLAMEPSESNQYIVNMVAAVLVVIALWAYTKYTIKTSW